MRQDRHIGLTSLVERIWGKNTNVAFFFADVAMLIFFLVMLVTGISMTLFVVNQRSPSMNLPMWIPLPLNPGWRLFPELRNPHPYSKKAGAIVMRGIVPCNSA